MINKIDISFKKISQALHNFTFPETDVVIGIGRGGIVPASIIAHQLQTNLLIIRISHRDDQNQPKYESPVFIDELWPDLEANTRILIVDDVSVSGKTLSLVKSKFNYYKVQTFVLKGKADLVLFPEISNCVNWPWNS